MDKDIYNYDYLGRLLDEDLLSDGEVGFMLGYLNEAS